MALDPITAGIEFISRVSDKIWPSAEAKAEGMLKLEQLRQTGELATLTAETELVKAQLAINQTEADSTSLFVSGWRPFIGWICGAAFAYHYVVQPLLAFVLAATGHPVDLPAFSMETLLTVLFGMLGLGGLRTFERVKGISK